jgi:hypothetical protein
VPAGAAHQALVGARQVFERVVHDREAEAPCCKAKRLTVFTPTTSSPSSSKVGSRSGAM